MHNASKAYTSLRYFCPRRRAAQLVRFPCIPGRWRVLYFAHSFKMVTSNEWVTGPGKTLFRPVWPAFLDNAPRKALCARDKLMQTQSSDDIRWGASQ